MDTTRPLTIDPELARRLKEAAAAGHSVAVTIDDRTYRLSITPEPVAETADLWENYDPERVRAAVVAAADIFSEEEAEALIERVYEAREAGSRPADRP